MFDVILSFFTIICFIIFILRYFRTICENAKLRAFKDMHVGSRATDKEPKDKTNFFRIKYKEELK